MDKIVDHLFIFRGNGEVEGFPGNYSDFRAYDSTAVVEEKEPVKEIETQSAKNNWKTSESTLTYQEQKEYNKLEREIAQLERDKKAKEKVFLNPDLSGEAINDASIELQKIEDNIEKKTERWFELGAKLEG